ncbi:hypothetical protein NDU88_003016 [Pleurodeles waltl]|uniref:Uncharacterized protein n=1 Tax=Pleurodeles waltl TaxID=8319 RepID=A0AAV7MQF7_PLEWA|nr:hypothetical protein NDU88_003016 [Pleurodeles waltl]
MERLGRITELQRDKRALALPDFNNSNCDAEEFALKKGNVGGKHAFIRRLAICSPKQRRRNMSRSSCRGKLKPRAPRVRCGVLAARGVVGYQLDTRLSVSRTEMDSCIASA